MVTNIAETTTSTTTPGDPAMATTLPETKTPTTSSTTTAITTTTTIPDTTYTVVDTTTAELTTPADDTTIIVAISVSAVVCIFLILAICILIYKRGEKKRKQKRTLEADDDSVFTANAKRTKESRPKVSVRLSTIVETGQSHDDTVQNSQSASTERYVNGKHLNAATDENVNVEPQYENFMASQQANEEDNYIDPNVPEAAEISNRKNSKESEKNPSSSIYEDTDDGNVPTHLKNAENKRKIPKITENKDTDSFYENMQSTQSYGNIDDVDNKSAIYQNEEETREAGGQSFYEEPIQKDSNDIYEDMA